MIRVSEEDKKIIIELQARLKSEGITLSLGKVAGYAARKVLLK